MIAYQLSRCFLRAAFRYPVPAQASQQPVFSSGKLCKFSVAVLQYDNLIGLVPTTGSGRLKTQVLGHMALAMSSTAIT